MAVSIATASVALKDIYLEPAREQLNIETNAFYNQIEKTARRIDGNSVKIYIPYGVNGGVGSTGESSALPISGSNQAKVFTETLKDVYATLSITQKAIDLTKSSSASFVNLLTDQMTKLVKTAKFNDSRQLFGDSTGVLATVSSVTTSGGVSVVTLNSVQYLMEGMLIDFYTSGGSAVSGAVTTSSTPVMIMAIDRANKTITLNATYSNVAGTNKVYNQGSKDNELTGLSAIFNNSTIYGVDRTNLYWLKPYTKALNNTISDAVIQNMIDYVDQYGGVTPDYLSCSYGVRRAYIDYLASTKRTVNTLELQGGYKAISYNGLPLTADKHETAGAMRFLTTDAFALNQPADWDWMKEDSSGSILEQVPGYPSYTATLYKFRELSCTHMLGQAVLTDITEI